MAGVRQPISWPKNSTFGSEEPPGRGKRLLASARRRVHRTIARRKLAESTAAPAAPAIFAGRWSQFGSSCSGRGRFPMLTKAGWKGIGSWSTCATRAVFHDEGGKGAPTRSYTFNLAPTRSRIDFETSVVRVAAGQP